MTEKDHLSATRWRKFTQAAKRTWNPEKGSITFYLPTEAAYRDFVSAVDALQDPGPDSIKSPENISTLTIVVSKNVEKRHLEMIFSCISILRGVVSVQADVTDPGHYAAIERAKADLRKQVLAVIGRDTHPESRPSRRGDDD